MWITYIYSQKLLANKSFASIIASNVDVAHNVFSINCWSLAPELGIIASRSAGATAYTSNLAEGTTGAINRLNVITWTTYN